MKAGRRDRRGVRPLEPTDGVTLAKLAETGPLPFPVVAYVASDAATVLRRIGSAWTTAPIGTTETLRKLRGGEQP